MPTPARTVTAAARHRSGIRVIDDAEQQQNDADQPNDADQQPADPLWEIEQAARTTSSAKVRVNRTDERGNAAFIADIDGLDFTAESVQRFGPGRYQLQVRDTGTGQYILARRVSVAAAPRPAPRVAHDPSTAAGYAAMFSSSPEAAPTDALASTLERIAARLERIERAAASPAAPALGGLTIADILAIADRKSQGMTPQDFAAVAGVFKQRDPAPLAEQIEAIKAIQSMTQGNAGGEGEAPDPLAAIAAAVLPKILELASKPAQPAPQQQQRPRHPAQPTRPALAGSPTPPKPATPPPAPPPALALAREWHIPEAQRRQLAAMLEMFAALPNRSSADAAAIIANNLPADAWEALAAIPPGALADELADTAPATLGHHRAFLDAVEIELREMAPTDAADDDQPQEADNPGGLDNPKDPNDDAPGVADIPGQELMRDGSGVPLVHTGHTNPPGVDEPTQPPKRRSRKGAPQA